VNVEHVPVTATTHAGTGDTNCYLVGREAAVLVDPAVRHPDLDALVDGPVVDHVAVTHHHPDHVGAVAAYAEECDATVWGRQGRERSFEAATGVVPDRTFREGTTIPADDPLRVVETPGHAPEHVAFAHEAPPGDALVTGDLAVESGSVVVGAPEGDMRAYVTSLRRVYARDPAILYPGHGPYVEAPRTTCERLIRHRLDREARVEEAVRKGARTVEEVLARAYDKDLTGVRGMAAATVEAHLEKLAAEGRVVWDGGAARPASESR
jgi:glyoxylase-like metal-dependent hydrolase (beta-lactamase superfamily II)